MRDFDELSEEEKKEIRESAAWIDGIARRALAQFQKPQNAPKCPELPHKIANRQNEPTPTRKSPPTAIQHEGNVQSDPIKSHEMPRSAPKCPIGRVEMQNEPTDPSRTLSRRLSPRQLTAISALFAGHSLTEIARHLRVDRKTLFRWRRRPEFLAELDRRYAQQMRPRGRG